MIKQVITGAALVATLALNATPVFAEDSMSSTRPERNHNRGPERCVQVMQQIDNRIDRFHNNKEGFVNAAQNLKDKINRLVQKADSKDLDTTKVKADITILNSKIDKLKADHQTFIDKLQAGKQINCGQNREEFRAALQDAKSQFQVLKSDWKDIKDFWKNTLKPDLKALKG